MTSTRSSQLPNDWQGIWQLSLSQKRQTLALLQTWSLSLKFDGMLLTCCCYISSTTGQNALWSYVYDLGLHILRHLLPNLLCLDGIFQCQLEVIFCQCVQGIR